MTGSQILFKQFWSYGSLYLAFLILSLVSQEAFIMLAPFIVLAIPLLIKRIERVFLLLLFCIPLSSELMITASLGTDMPDEILMVATTAIILLMLLHKPVLLSRTFFSNQLVYLLALHLIWIFITVLFSENAGLSLKYLLAKLWYIIPFVIGVQLFIKDARSLKHIAFALLLPACLIAVLSILRHSIYAFTFESIKYTLSPFFRNHVVYAAMISLMVPIVAGGIYLSENKNLTKIWITALCFFITAIILSYSRGAWLALFFAAIVVIAIRIKFVKWLLIGVTTSVLILFLWLAHGNRYLNFRPDYNHTVFHTDFSDHMVATYEFNDVSTAERFHRWIGAVRLASDHPVVGVGPNNFFDHYKSYTVGAYRTWVSSNDDHSTTHNYFLLILSEQGYVGLIIFLILLFAMFVHAQKIYHGTSNRFYKVSILCITAILSIIVVENFLNDFIETDKIGSVFFLCIGLLIRIKQLDWETKLLKNSFPHI